MGCEAKAVILIDLQRDFFVSSHLAEVREALLGNVNSLVRRAVELHVPVINVRTEHRVDRSTWALNMREDNQGVVLEGTRGAQPLEELLSGTIEVVKTRDSAFYRTDLADVLDERRITELVLAGVSTEACVSVTAADAYARDFRVTLAADCIDSADPDAHEPALSWLNSQYRQPALTHRQVDFQT